MLRLFNIPANAPFLPTLASALWEGRLVEGFPGGDPLGLSDAVVYLPTQRAARAFAGALIAASGRAGLALPRIVPLGAFSTEEGEGAEFEDEPLEAKPAVGDLERRMTLARLIAAWGAALKGAIRRMGPDGRLETDPSEPPLAASTPAQALALAGDLAALIDDLRIEGVGFERLGGLVADSFDPYWRITLDFLKIASEAWPAWLTEKGLADRAERAEAAVDREIARLAKRGPTIVAGSTGVNAATARLIAAVARAPNGAVVLPGLDLALDETDFAALAQGVEPTTATHPQAALARLMKRLGAVRDDVIRLAEADVRAAFLSQALRPAETTHLWRGAPRDVAAALDGMALIEAPTQAEESLAVALALRETLETPGRTAALITPDPALARRVAADLARWGIEVENSSGATLGATPEGVFARLTLAAAHEFSATAFAALLACPSVRVARSPPAFAAAARALELGVLRAPLPVMGLEDSAAAFAAAREAAASSYAHRAIKALKPDDFAAAEALLADLAAALRPLREADGGPLAALIAAHRAALVALSGPDEIGEGVADLLDEWALASGDGFACGLADYAEMFETLAAGRAPPSPRGHPRLVLLGLLEARLLCFDRLVLAGLDETVWPPAASTDAFLNRQMRADLGLSPPERRIGQTAHDFAQALGAHDVILTRAFKRDGTPTVASRLLRRLAAFAGEPAYDALRARGARYLDIAAQVDAPEPSAPAERPAPAPPVDLRPTRLSVTRIETLRRDPYAIYAERVLQLAPLPKVGASLTAAALGDVWHKALETYALSASGDLGQARLFACAEAGFAPLNADPGFHALRWPRIVEALEVFLAFDEHRRELAERIFIEKEARLDFALADGSTFTLTARADRIEIGRDGLATIIDYKTGAPPGVNEVKVGFSPQMTLQAALLKRGAFEGVGAFETEGAIYLKLGGKDGGVEKPIRFKDANFAEVAEAHFTGLVALLAEYRRPATGYVSRPYPKFAAKGADYDHLARVAEWSLAESDET
jgi:ATP-dependent helicase/nuclease subunit B